MKTCLMISALVCAVSGRPQFLTNFAAHPYAVASAPLVTYEQNIIPDTEPAPVVPFAPFAFQPAVAPIDVASQYHSQDEFGQFAFGHASLGQAHQQTRDFTGAVRGSYTYINPDGEQVVAHYIADAGGFRVSSNALPVAPTFDGVAPVAPVFDLEAPVFDLEAPVFDLEQVEDTEEVVAAIAEHFRLVEEHKALVAAAAVADAAEAEAEAEASVGDEPVVRNVEEVIVEEEEAVTEASTAVEEVIVEDAAPVVPAPLDAEGNVVDTEEVEAAIAEHLRLVEEHKGLVAAAAVADAAEAETQAPVGDEPVKRTEEEVVTEAVVAAVEEESTVEEVIVEETEPVVPAPLDAEGNVVDTVEVEAAIAEHLRLTEEHNAIVAAALAAATPEEE